MKEWLKKHRFDITLIIIIIVLLISNAISCNCYWSAINMKGDGIIKNEWSNK